jgi:hypothetical protein
MSEGTRCGPPAEFDFMLLNNSWKPLNDFFEIIDDVLRLSAVFKGGRFALISCLHRAPRVKLEVLFSGQLYKHLVISIDLIPFSPLCVEQLYGSHRWTDFVSFDGCHVYDIMEELPSYTDYEERVMQNLPEAAKEAYILLKALHSPQLLGKCAWLTSYRIKQSLLHRFGDLLQRSTDVGGVTRKDWMRESVLGLRKVPDDVYLYVVVSENQDEQRPHLLTLKGSNERAGTE